MRTLCLVLSVVWLGVNGAVLADEASHRAAAEELLVQAGTKQAMNASIDTMLEAQIKANKAIAPMKQVMRDFLSKQLSFESLKEELIDLYVKEFSEEELKEITAFYRTPAGKKLVEKQPVLLQKGVELGIRRVQASSAELQQLIQAELNKKNAQ